MARLQDSPMGRWLQPNAAVGIANFATASRFNGHTGQLIGFDGDCAYVQLPTVLGGVVLSVPPECLQPLQRGDLVELAGSSAGNEGEVGVVEDLDPVATQYIVRVSKDETRLVSATSLIARSRLWDMDISQSHSYFGWRQEQMCRFVDELGITRRYMLHLPIGFSLQAFAKALETNTTLNTLSLEANGIGNAGTKGNNGDIRPPTWPLLVYMHGTGGGTLFSHSKKSLRSEGLQFAAHNFVVVSPECEWSWRGSPGSWVTELVRTLRAAEWIDRSRVYLTGCSMGGMGAWEVGSMAPELFAAIVPVAAHHKSELRGHVASRLRETPVYVFHSLSDETCPLINEEPLWVKMAADGNMNRYFFLQILQGVDHYNVYDIAYCNDPGMYKWLLECMKGGA